MPTGAPSQVQTGIGALLAGLAGGYGQEKAAQRQAAYQQALFGVKQAAAEKANGGFGGRAGASVINGLLSSAEKNRLDSMQNYIPLHNQIVDAILDVQKGNTSQAYGALNSILAKNPTLSGYFQGQNVDGTSSMSVYHALTRLAGGELAKMQTGSIAKPTEEDIRNNQAVYPVDSEIISKSPNVPKKLNALNDSLALSAITGPEQRLGLYKMPDGNFMTPYHEGMYDQLEQRRTGFRDKLKYIPEYEVDANGQSVVPGSSNAPMAADVMKPPKVYPQPQNGGIAKPKAIAAPAATDSTDHSALWGD